jgi:DNA-binding SARP family transcriptional activator
LYDLRVDGAGREAYLAPGMSSPARALIREAAAEQRARAETIRRLLLALEDQRQRLDAQLGEALGALDDVALDAQVALPTDAHVRVHCLGTFRVEISGAPLQNWRSSKARALFQYLVLCRDRPVRREELIEALWNDPDAAAAGSSLKVTVHALRQLLRSPGKAGPDLEIQAHGAGYQLRASDVWVDVEEFERSVARGRQLEAAGDGVAGLNAYRRAADLHQGDFLSDSWDEWVVFRREGLKDEYMLALARLADAALEAGDYHDCIRRCRQLLREDRCREDTFRTLMLCHARLGQPGRVQRWFELCTTTLRRDLDAEPEPETVRLYEQALGGGRSKGQQCD